MSNEEKKTNSKKTENKKNTMTIKLQNSKGDKINISGPCSDKEIKAICKAINRTPDQKVEMINHG